MPLAPALSRLTAHSIGQNTAHRRAILTAGTLSLLLTPQAGAMAEFSSSTLPGGGGGVPSDVKTLINDVLKVYVSRDGKEQGRIVQQYYREDGHFVDPLMDSKGHEEIALAFFSLIKIFKQVEVNQKSAEIKTPPQLPKDLLGGNFHQVQVRNQQVYHFARTGFLARWIFPQLVDLDVTTTLTIDPQAGKIVRHQDVWNNKGFGAFSFMKRPNGAFSGALFKLLGWKKEVGFSSKAKQEL